MYRIDTKNVCTASEMHLKHDLYAVSNQSILHHLRQNEMDRCFKVYEIELSKPIRETIL